jgi:transcriptional regulator with XRE-family HTH domain
MNASELQMKFGTGLAAWRKQRGFTQVTLGKAAGLHRTFIADVEHGRRNVSLQSMAKLAGALEISIPDLFQPPPTRRT